MSRATSLIQLQDLGNVKDLKLNPHGFRAGVRHEQSASSRAVGRMKSDRLMEAGGFRLQVRLEGAQTGPPIVLLHGFSHSLQTWDRWAVNLGRDHRVVRFDLPGHGRSGPDPHERYSNEDTIDALDALLRALAIRRPVLVGNSLGGLVAWRRAARRPRDVRGLILIAPGGFSINGVAEHPAGAPPAVEAYLRTAPLEAVRLAMQALYGDPSRLSKKRIDAARSAIAGDGVGDALVRRLAQFTLPDPTRDLARVRAPTLLLWGGRDVIIPPEHAERFHAALPNSRRIVYDDLGHLPHEEAPARTLADARAFLGELQP
jgi:pimeloyl-ACP methyl ester carboxylesterase